MELTASWIWLAGAVAAAGFVWLVARKPWENHAQVVVAASAPDVAQEPQRESRVVLRPSRRAGNQSRVSSAASKVIIEGGRIIVETDEPTGPIGPLEPNDGLSESPTRS